MSNANTSLNFQNALKQYPCENLDYCDAIGGPCQYKDNILNCPVREHILNQTIKMCDSGIFMRYGTNLTYEQLFQIYTRMGVKYGIMIDVFRDSQATIESAKAAIAAYKPYKNEIDSFNLVGVAQGESIEEYLDCYAQLKQLGFTHVAVGGLLRRYENTVRYAALRSREFMFQVLGELRQQYPDDWLFALGCFHPSRLSGLKKLDVWADYKGWIFQYKKKNLTLNTQLKNFLSNYLDLLEAKEVKTQVAKMQELIDNRNQAVVRQKNLSQELYNGRRNLRVKMSNLYQELQKEIPEIAPKFRNFTTYGILNKDQEKMVIKALHNLGKKHSEEAEQLLENIDKNRQLNEQIKSEENYLNQINTLLAEQITRLAANGVQLSAATQRVCAEITEVIKSTEQSHRLQQVRSNMAQEILAELS
ncbi:hypothetical protein H6F79_26790 [Trichocoleus sp. FACHB-69]|nr:hypothetical protein [Trichocoleus sp. FACHB-69]